MKRNKQAGQSGTVIDLSKLAYIPTPYRKGYSVREDIFWREFSVTFYGLAEYPEDDPIYGTYKTSSSIEVGHHGLIEQAMELAGQVLSGGKFRKFLDEDALGFGADRVRIHDRKGLLVLAGRIGALHKIEWDMPPGDAAEERSLKERIEALRRDAFVEHGWDNYSTAQRLNDQAAALEGRLVHPDWRVHAVKAVQSLQAN